MYKSSLRDVKKHLTVQLQGVGPVLGGVNFTGFLDQEFTFGGAATFNAPFATALESTSNFINSISSLATTIVGSEVLKMPQIQIKSLATTFFVWTGSERPTLNCSFNFVQTKESDPSVLSKAKILTKACYPDKGFGHLKAPGGYKVLGKDKVEGVWDLYVGEWFRATNLVLNSVSIVYSKEILPNKAPLYCTAQVQLQPWRLLSTQDIEDWFLIKV